MNNGEDQGFARRLGRAGIEAADPCGLGFQPFYVYLWGNNRWHLSGMGRDGYRRLGRLRAEKSTLTIADPPMLDLDQPTILPGVRPRVF